MHQLVHMRTCWKCALSDWSHHSCSQAADRAYDGAKVTFFFSTYSVQDPSLWDGAAHIRVGLPSSVNLSRNTLQIQPEVPPRSSQIPSIWQSRQ